MAFVTGTPVRRSRRSSRSNRSGLGRVAAAVGQLAEGEEAVLAPDAEHGAAVDGAGFGEGYELIVDGAADAGLEGGCAVGAADKNVGGGLVGRAVRTDTDGVVGAGADDLVDVGAEGEGLGAAGAGPVHLDSHPGSILDLDAAAFNGGFEPIRTVGLAFKDGGKEADHLSPANGGATVKPGAVALDEKGEIAAFPGRAAGTVQVRRKRTSDRNGVGPPEHGIVHDC